MASHDHKCQQNTFDWTPLSERFNLWFYTSILFLMSFIDVTCRCCHSLAASHHQKHHANSTTILWPMALPSSEVLPGLLWVACLFCVFPESTPLWHAQAQHDLFLHGCNIMRWNRKFHKLKTACSDRFHHALSLWVCFKIVYFGS